MHIIKYLGDPGLNMEFICASCASHVHKVKVILDNAFSAPVLWLPPLTGHGMEFSTYGLMGTLRTLWSYEQWI